MVPTSYDFLIFTAMLPSTVWLAVVMIIIIIIIIIIIPPLAVFYDNLRKLFQWTTVGAGTSQGTVSGPNDFKVVINDLSFNTAYAKYIDDTTVLSVSKNVNDDTLQACAVYLVHWT